MRRRNANSLGIALATVLALSLAGCAPQGSAGTSTEPTTGITSTTAESAPSSSSTTTGSTVAGEPDPAQVGELLALGDWGSGDESEAEVSSAMSDYSAGRDIAAILTTGDNFYTDDVDEMMAPWAWVSERGIPFVAAWGNHDIHSAARIAEVEEALGDPPRWRVFEWGSVQVVILDSNQVDSEQQQSFLEETLAASDEPTMVVFHHPPFTCGGHDDAKGVVDNWLPVFDDDVFLVLNGHDHNYQRFARDGVTYVVTGGGGKRVYDLTECPSGHPERLAGAAAHHFLSIEQDRALAISVIDVDGEVIDSFEVALP